MLFKENNKEKINAMFAEANGKCRERILTYDNVEAALTKIERQLGIAKKDMVGIVALIDPNAQDFPRAYKYTPYSIYCIAVRKASGWDVEPFGKSRTARASRMASLTLTDRAKEAILESKLYLS